MHIFDWLLSRRIREYDIEKSALHAGVFLRISLIWIDKQVCSVVEQIIRSPCIAALEVKLIKIR